VHFGAVVDPISAGVTISLFTMALGFALQQHLQRRTRFVAAFVGAGVAALVLIQVFGGGVSSRFNLHGLADEGRLSTWRATLRLIVDHPWFGIGLGTFAWGFPACRSTDVSMWGVWDRAHGTPLELAAELGIPLAAAVVIGCIAILFLLASGVHARRRDRFIPLAAFSVALIAFLHSCIDFPLQVSGFAIVAFGIAGVGVGFAGEREPERLRDRRQGTLPLRRPSSWGGDARPEA
jgi:O-antigen ligase